MKIYVDNERDELLLIRTLKFATNFMRLDQNLHEIVSILDDIWVIRVPSESIQPAIKRMYVSIDEQGIKTFDFVRSVAFYNGYIFSVNLAEEIIVKVNGLLEAKKFGQALSLVLHSGKNIMWENFDAGCMKILQKFI